MYMTADACIQPKSDARALDPIERELREIEDLRRRTLQSRDLLYCSPPARHIVEREVPRLIGVIRGLRGSTQEIPTRSESWVEELLLDLRREVSILRDLVERS